MPDINAGADNSNIAWRQLCCYLSVLVACAPGRARTPRTMQAHPGAGTEWHFRWIRFQRRV
jgi:hypothetical protein